MNVNLHIGDVFEALINWMARAFKPFFDGVSATVETAISWFEAVLLATPVWVIVGITGVLAWALARRVSKKWAWVAGAGTLILLFAIYGVSAGTSIIPRLPSNWYMIVLFSMLAWYLAGRGVGIFGFFGLFLIDFMNLWGPSMETVALVFAAAFFALAIGVPVGIFASRSDLAERIVRPILDFMQTMPAFIYLVPAILFFTLGKVPGAMATVIFAMPPAVRLTSLGIRQVPEEVVEAARAFGSTPRQMLLKVQLPIALPTILAGVNQTIMLALSMVVIAALIGAGGLGEQVLKGVTQLKIGLGFESGIAVVILAMLLDRVTQALGSGAAGTRK